MIFSTRKLAKLSATSLFKDEDGRMFSLVFVVRACYFVEIFDLLLPVLSCSLTVLFWSGVSVSYSICQHVGSAFCLIQFEFMSNFSSFLLWIFSFCASLLHLFVSCLLLWVHVFL